MGAWAARLLAGLIVLSIVVPVSADYGQAHCDTDIAFESDEPEAYMIDENGVTLWIGPGTRIVLTADCDPGYETEEIRYRVDTGPEQVYEGPFHLPEETRSYAVRYWAIDTQGGVEDAEQWIMTMDATPPKVADVDPERGEVAYSDEHRYEDPRGQTERAVILEGARVRATLVDEHTEVWRSRTFVDGDPVDPLGRYHSDAETYTEMYCNTGRDNPCGPGEHEISYRVVDIFGNAATGSLPVDVRPYAWSDYYETWDEIRSIPPVP